MTEPVVPNMRFTFNLPTRDEYDDFCWFDQAFSPHEVAGILRMAESVPAETAAVGSERAVNDTIRSSTVRWVHPSSENFWLFDRIPVSSAAATTFATASIYGP